MKGGDWGPNPTLPFLPSRCTRPRDSLWQHAVSMLAFKSRFYPSGEGYPKRCLGISYTCICAPVAKSDSREPGTRRRLPHYGTENRRGRGQGGGASLISRRGSLHGSAHPNNLTPLIRGSRWFLTPSHPRIYSRKLGIVDTEPMVCVLQLRRDRNGQKAARVLPTFVLFKEYDTFCIRVS